MAELYIDSIPLKDFGLMLVNYKIPSMPELDIKEIKIPGRDGTLFINSTLKSNEIDVEVAIIDDDKVNILNKIRNFISFMNPKNGYKQLIFDDDLDVCRYARLINSNELEIIKAIDLTLATFTLKFKMYDPYIYSKEQEIVEKFFNVGEKFTIMNLGGIDTPMTIKVYIGDESTGLPANGLGHSNPGENSAVSNIEIKINNEIIKYNGSLQIGQELLIDTKNFEMYIDNENVLRFWEGDFPQLKVGENEIEVNNLEGIPLYLIIEFRKRWL